MRGEKLIVSLPLPAGTVRGTQPSAPPAPNLRDIFRCLERRPREISSCATRSSSIYAWIFCQGGFPNIAITFEQFLMVVATLQRRDSVGALEYED